MAVIGLTRFYSSSSCKPEPTLCFLSIIFFVLSCCGNPDPSLEKKRALVFRIEELTYGAIYHVVGWVPAEVVEGLQLDTRTDLKIGLKQCIENIAPKECDRQHKWKSVTQTLPLAQINPRSVKIVEVDGAILDGNDTGHALIYRCHGNTTCTQGDLGSYATPAIPCRNRDACERARAALEELIVLAQPAKRPAT